MTRLLYGFINLNIFAYMDVFGYWVNKSWASDKWVCAKTDPYTNVTTNKYSIVSVFLFQHLI